MHVEIGDVTGDEDEIDRPVADHLIGDADVAALGVAGLWHSHATASCGAGSDRYQRNTDRTKKKGTVPAEAVDADLGCGNKPWRLSVYWKPFL
jgi:hypothetical protein